MTSGHLIPCCDLAALRHRDTHHHIDAGREIRVIFAGKHFHIHHFTAFAMGHAQGCIFHVARFLTEDGAQQTFFRCKFFFTFGSDLANENVIRTNFRTDADDAVFIKVFDRVIANIRDVAGDFFRSKLCIARFHFMLFNMNRSETVFLNKAL